jgi:RimJ/RimL family protein N-acetyltransferase
MASPFPAPLQTERLILRAPAPEDAPALTAAIDETFDQLNLWMPWAKSRKTLEQSDEVIARMMKKWIPEQDYVLFGFSRETGELILAGGLHPVNLEVPSFHIGYWCRTSQQGKGYVTEAVHAIRDAGFETVGAKRIEIRCDSRNTASRAVAERAGFPLEAVMVNDSRDNEGRLYSTAYYALTTED